MRSRHRCRTGPFGTTFPLLLVLTLLAALLPLPHTGAAATPARYRSHPPLRSAPPVSHRPMAVGAARFVDARRGQDTNDGTRGAPWRTVQAALERLRPGETLYLRGGVYYERVRCSITGRADAPITIRSYPGEQAILDGGLRQFAERPEQAWQPYPGGAPGEYRSARPYRNVRDVVGRFGDSLVGLQTYWHAEDLRAANEQWVRDPAKPRMVRPVYCGPGLWYDRATGYIHARLAHTHLDNPALADYRGETDPRRLPLLIAPFHAVPLLVDQAMHVRFQDLIIRGAGFNAVVLDAGVDVAFENVTVWAGTYGVRARSTGPLRFVDSAIYGMIPPWGSRDENSLHSGTPGGFDPYVPPPAGEEARNIARLPTHALLVTEGSYEFEVFYYPHNHDWEIRNSEFADGHDGVYLSGHNIRFHHNLVESCQDDALYLSSPSPGFDDNIRIYQNVIRKALTAFGCHSRGGPGGNIFIYRNLVDLRDGVFFSRPTPENPRGIVTSYHIFLMHGRDFLGVESLSFYQNTFISPTVSSSYAHRTLQHTSAQTQRRSFNNLFVYLNAYPPFTVGRAGEHDIQCDGNLHWCPAAGAVPPPGYPGTAHAVSAGTRPGPSVPPGWEASSVVGDPRFTRFSVAPASPNDYRLQADSPALGHGVPLPPEWEDPLRRADGARPDIGALPRGTEPLRVGRRAVP
jgi:hypothetical protein